MSNKNPSPYDALAHFTSEEAFVGGLISVKDAASEFGLSTLTVAKRITAAALEPTGKLVTGARGKPAKLYKRNDLGPLLIKSIKAEDDENLAPAPLL